MAENVLDILGIDKRAFAKFVVDNMPGWGDSVWLMQRQIVDAVLMNTGMMLSYLEAATEFLNDEFTNLENFFKTKVCHCF